MLVVLSIIADENMFSLYRLPIILAVALLGTALNALWSINIRSYKQLNTGKFAVIHEMEKELPFACYDREWEILGAGVERKKYLQLTRVERYVPLLLALPYLALLILSVAMLF